MELRHMPRPVLTTVILTTVELSQKPPLFSDQTVVVRHGEDVNDPERLHSQRLHVPW